MKTLYTFGLKYKDGDLEEIDVTAHDLVEARQEAERVAREGYVPGWTLVELPAGGSSGLVQIFSL